MRWVTANSLKRKSVIFGKVSEEAVLMIVWILQSQISSFMIVYNVYHNVLIRGEDDCAGYMLLSSGPAKVFL